MTFHDRAAEGPSTELALLVLVAEAIQSISLTPDPIQLDRIYAGLCSSAPHIFPLRFRALVEISEHGLRTDPSRELDPSSVLPEGPTAAHESPTLSPDIDRGDRK
jgi:hypothetical protein